MSTQTQADSQQRVIREIAKSKLQIENLATRNSDSLDFHDCAVWSIEAALVAAYQAGYEAKESELLANKK